MTKIKINSEFAHELVLAVPYAYWLHKQGRLEKVITSKGMSPFYYFCKNVEERFNIRTIDNSSAGLNDLPNSWIHHNSLAVTGKPYGELIGEEQDKINGVLDYSKWSPPSYWKHYENLNFDKKPFVVINNNYNIEYGMIESDSSRFFDIKCLYEFFSYLTEKGYVVIYKRPDNTEFAPDQNEINTLQKNLCLSANVKGLGIISDYDLCEYYDGKVINMNKLKLEYPDYSYNEFQLRLFANSSGFITPNGGGGILCGYFKAPIIMHVPHGKELRTNYLTNKDSYYQKLSENKLYTVLDPNNESNYQKILKKVKEIF